MSTSMIRRAAPLAAAAALALSACSAEEKASFDSASPQSAQPASQSVSPQSASTASSGTATDDPAQDTAAAAGIDLNNLGEPIASVSVPAKVAGDPKATLKVSMYSLKRQGDTLIGNYSFTLDSTADPELNEWLYDYLGSWSWAPHLIDTTNLNRHDVLTAKTSEKAITSSQDTTRFGPGDTVYGYAAFAAPPADVTSMMASLIDGAAAVEVQIQ